MRARLTIGHNSRCRAQYAALVLLFVAGFSALHAQSVNARLDAALYEAGDPVTLTLTADLLRSEQVAWPPLSEPLPGLELIADQTDTLDHGLVRRLQYLQFDTGFFVLPPMPIALIRDQDSSVLYTPSLSYRVVWTAVDSAAAIRPIEDIKPIDYKPRPWWLPWLLGGLLILLALGLFYRYYWLRRPVPAPVQTPEPEAPRSADVLALERLHALEEKKLWQSGAIKQYHTELTDILRTYIEERYGEPALESTTAELMLRLSPYPIPDTSREQLGAVLRLADLVKFAKAQPLADQHAQVMRQAFAFVEATRPAPALSPTPSRTETEQP